MPVRTGKDLDGKCYARWGSKTKYYYTCGNSTAREAAKKKAAKQGAAAYAGGYKGNDMKSGLQKVIVNFNGLVRHDKMMGRDYLVAPMSMITEGVHEGSGGPLLYPKDELFKIPEVWNHKPVVVYHPARNGAGISACDPIILSNRQVGVIMNTRAGEVTVDNVKVPALLAEAWMEEDRMNKVDERIANAIEKNEMMELSTGLFTDNESAEEGAEWNGEKYDAIARNYRPDHLALLPDLKGACSIEDGAGFLRLNAKSDKIHITGNAMSHGNIRSLLNSWLQEENKSDEVYDIYVEDVYESFFIYMKSGKYFKHDYSLVDNQIIITGDAKEVVRVTEWRGLNGEFIGNKKQKKTVSNINEENDDSKRKENTMDEKKKVKIIDALIACSTNSWSKDDRKTLEASDDAVLEKMLEGTIAAEKAVENATKKGAEDAKAKMTTNQEEKKVEAETKVKEDAASEGTSTEAETKKETAAEEKPAENKKPKTTEEYVNAAPPEVRNALKGMLNRDKAIKTKLIKNITDNEKNQFDEKELQKKEISELRKLAAMLPGEEKEETTLNDYTGLEDVEDITENTEEPLVMPSCVSAE